MLFGFTVAFGVVVDVVLIELVAVGLVVVVAKGVPTVEGATVVTGVDAVVDAVVDAEIVAVEMFELVTPWFNLLQPVNASAQRLRKSMRFFDGIDNYSFLTEILL